MGRLRQRLSFYLTVCISVSCIFFVFPSPPCDLVEGIIYIVGLDHNASVVSKKEAYKGENGTHHAA
jgi:hypothetical protein